MFCSLIQCFHFWDVYIPDSDCLQPRVTGPCRAAFVKFYFDQTEGTCKKFTYGGCQGNDNNFETRQECLNKCAESIPGICMYTVLA